jgi:hypothetical protein
MNSLQVLSLFFNNIISLGSSVLLLYVDIGIHRDIKELNVLFSSLFSAVNFYTIYSSYKCDELGYSKDYKAVNEETLREDEASRDFSHLESNADDNIWSSHESNMINAPLDSLYDNGCDDDLYEEKI